MKNLSEMVYEASEDQVYAIYLEDGTLYNYYEDEAAAKKEADELNKESKCNVWHLRYSGHQVKQILDWLYKDANYYMQRKYIKYQLLSSLKTG